ncbi:MAG: hypothetical protein M0042_01975 [Nitrospiraceae bacterium]|nr:hypothetical protein [Nitrospiraceae bacterium]
MNRPSKNRQVNRMVGSCTTDAAFDAILPAAGHAANPDRQFSGGGERDRA